MESWHPPEPPAIPEGATLASIGSRALAWILDQLLVGIPAGILAVVVLSTKLDLFAQPAPGVEEMAEVTPAWVVALPVVMRVVYEAGMIGWLGQTVGMMALRIQVHASDGGRLDWSRSGIRALVPGMANAVPGVGPFLLLGVYLSANFDDLRRGLHDRAAGSLVLVRPRPAPIPPPTGWYPQPGSWPQQPPPGGWQQPPPGGWQQPPPGGPPHQGPPAQGPPPAAPER